MTILGTKIFAASRARRLEKMSDAELERLNGVLCGKGHNWATAERIAVAKELGNRMTNFFKQVPLKEEFEKVLTDNLDSLYDV